MISVEAWRLLLCCDDTDHDACESVRWSNQALCGADVEAQAEVQNLG